MSNEEKKKHIEDLLKDVNFLAVHDVLYINHKPHPYVIGAQHIHNSSSMYLDIEECERKGVKCAHPGCNLPYKEHTSDNVCALILTADTTNEAMNVELKTLLTD